MLHRIQCGPDVAALSEPQSEGLTSSLLPCPSCSALLTGGVWPGGLRWSDPVVPWTESTVWYDASTVMFVFYFFFLLQAEEKALMQPFLLYKEHNESVDPRTQPTPQTPPSPLVVVADVMLNYQVSECF